MMVTSFTVRNHKSVRDEVTIDLTRPRLRTLQPKRGSSWAESLYPIVGIFGGNATGKSALLDALVYTFTAVRDSSTTWQLRKSIPRAPFLLDSSGDEASSTYVLGFVHEERRHEYGFEVDASGIVHEWLRDVPTVRWRVLFDRRRETPGSAPMQVNDKELVLSRARLLTESPWHGVASALVEDVDVVLVKDAYREARLRSIADRLLDGSITGQDLEALLRVADIGVVGIHVEEQPMPVTVQQALIDLVTKIPRDEEDDSAQENAALELETVIRRLTFTHQSAGKQVRPFRVDDESDGTIAWLAVAVPALDALRSGGLVLIDELDASLHPHLMDLLLSAFADQAVNQHGAQIIFTSHETYILSPLSEVSLEPEQVWLTDKLRDGVTILTCLADFPRHRDANVAKRYLTGRYGGTPRLSPSLMHALVGVSEG